MSTPTSIPVAILILTGSELTSGETHDLNGPFLATHLGVIGVAVEEIRLVPDDDELLERAFREAIDRADVVLVSGGLGPTADDRTVAVLASVVGRAVVRDDGALQQMQARAADRGRDVAKLPANYYKQAEVVEGSEVLANPVGLAPGCVVAPAAGGRGFVVVMPGVPKELRSMFTERVAPLLQERFALAPPRLFRGKVLGHGESWVEERIQRLEIDNDRIDYGISAKPGELTLRFLARRPEDHAYLDEVRARLEGEFGDDFVAFPDGLVDDTGTAFDIGHTRLVHELLMTAGVTIATAESCTGGLIAKRLTDHPGSSSYFVGSVVAYKNEVKQAMLGVEESTIAAHGAVSAEVCEAMARAARERFGADYGIGVTGVAGPGGGSDDKPVGLVFVGLARPDGGVLVESHRFWGDRGNVRTLTAVRALDLLRRELAPRL